MADWSPPEASKEWTPPEAKPADEDVGGETFAKLPKFAQMPARTLVGGAEALGAATTGALSGLGGTVKGIAEGGYPAIPGKAEKIAEEFQRAHTYQPRTQMGKAAVGGLARGAEALSRTGIPQALAPVAGMTGELSQAGRAITPAARAVKDITRPAISRTAALQEGLGTQLGKKTGYFARPEPIASPEGLVSIGEKHAQKLTTKAKELFDARSKEAKVNYDNSLKAAREEQAKGNPFATSPQGQALLDSLENDKYQVAGGQKFLKSDAEINGINRLIQAIKGKTTGGEVTPIGKGKISAGITKKAPTETIQKDVTAMIDELRDLRDVNATGKPHEAYGALDAQYKRDLINKLEKSLYSWNDKYRVADEAYKAASEKLLPFKTRVMSRAMKGEKFDPSDLVASPEELPRIFFKTKDSVAQLKEVTGDPKFVADTAKEYVSTILENKTPEQVKAFAFNENNAGWMQEAGIKDTVQEYANKATKAENRRDIRKKIGYGALGLAIGTGAAGKIGGIF